MAPRRFEPYTTLKPFEKLFQTGLPILMYHKLGPRPRGARLKGLYVSEDLFGRQLAELHEAGFRSVLLPGSGHPAVGGPRRIVLTFDDGCCNVLEFGLRLLARHQFQAIQFLVAGRLGGTNDWDLAQGEVPVALMDRDQVREWLAAGHQIGSHTVHHPWLTRLSPDWAREEITASKKMLEDTFGVPIEHFCYPYGDWNPRVRDLVAEAGYHTACTTEAGINLPETDRFALKRFTARYPSRNLKAVWARLRRRVSGV